MKAIILTILLLGALAHDTTIESLWNTWKIQNNKDYPDYETEAARFAAFNANYIFVQEWNNDPTHTSQVALNLFADLTSEEFGAMYTGAIPIDEDYVNAHVVIPENIEDPPSSWDWTEHGAVTPIKNQGQCGSCWAFSTVATAEGLYFINGNTLTSFSEQQIVDCDTTCDGCNGGWPYLAMKYVAANGLETESQYPYVGQQQTCAFNSANAIQTGITGSAFVKPREPGLLNAQVYQQPVAVIVEADQSSFQLYSTGVLSQGCGVNLDHAITAVGYTSTYAIVKNSWGTTWGQQGYVWISTSAKINNGAGACGILLQPQYPTGLSS